MSRLMKELKFAIFTAALFAIILGVCMVGVGHPYWAWFLFSGLIVGGLIAE